MDELRKIELVENILSSLSALESVAITIGTPSIIKALNKAKNTTGYALAQMSEKRAPG